MPHKTITDTPTLASALRHHAAQVITGEIVGITDGDTVKLLTADKQQIKIQLSDIDTPEKKQAYDSRAKQQGCCLTWCSVRR